MRTLLVTGRSGVGKSAMLRRFAENVSGVAILDGSRKNDDGVDSLDPHSVKVVALDHIALMPNSASTVKHVSEWCNLHNKALILVEQERIDLSKAMSSTDAALFGAVTEARFLGAGGDEGVEIDANGHRQHFTQDQFVTAFLGR